jgi:hypothetical protein
VDKNNEFSLDKAKEFLLSSPDHNTLIISGGEPTIHKDFLKIVEFAKLHYNNVTLMTNGIKFSDKSFLQATLDAGVNMLVIPFYSQKAKDYSWMVGNPHAYEKVILGLSNINELLAERSFGIQIKLLLAKFTYKLIPVSIDFIAANFPRIREVSLYGFNMGNKAFQNGDICAINYTDSQPFNDTAIRKLIEHGLKFIICKIPYCAFSKDTIELLIRQNRVLFPEEFYLKKPDRKTVLGSSQAYSPKECEPCSLNEFCPKIYGKNAHYFDFGVRPIIVK